MNTKQIQGFVPKKESFRKDADPFKPRSNTTPFVGNSPFQPGNMNGNMSMPPMAPVPVIVQGMPAQSAYAMPFDRSGVSAFVPPKTPANMVTPYSPQTPAPAHPAPKVPAPAAPKPAPAPEKPAPAAPVKPTQPVAKEQPAPKPSRPALAAPATSKLNLTPQRRGSMAERRGSIAERRGSVAERHPMISEERLAELVRVWGWSDA